jgi:4-hydroxythreonine-4-phosphate dehydrogenase
MSSSKPIMLALTMGDPAGIGPEIAARALGRSQLPADCRVFVVGDQCVMERACHWVSSPAPINVIAEPGEYRDGCINVLDLRTITLLEYTLGTMNAPCGRASYLYIIKGIRLAQDGLIDGVVTNPINKEALHAAGIAFPGHTEIFAHETGTTDYSMMFMLDQIAVVHVTTHCSLRQAIDRITTDRVLRQVRLLHRTLQALGIQHPRIAVGGLNPHAGEQGLFGTEEIEHIAPAIALALTEQIAVSGPFPPDTVFMRAFKGEFDGVVAMLHDHGFVALKSRDFARGVNVTIGLPIIRTSVGHGTAFDLAGTGKASETSLLEAIRVAARLSRSRPR